ncbi:MAG: hypothetical protein M1818_008240 [Claussenomyces sp. TS43310]|nr:MAG: hypothetical protein M1818_008240 [Claussenomyces sp. TS43310]
MQPFKYTPISLERGCGETRLVTIHPGHWTDRISCTIATVCIHDPVSFQALSYAWGQREITTEISLDDSSLSVTTNLEAALRHLRQDVPRVMWIDAICIDQRNLDERSSQVLMMRDIYEKADKTIVWLGEGTSQSRAAYKLMRDLTHDDELSEYDGPMRKSWNKLKLAYARKGGERFVGEFAYRAVFSLDPFRMNRILTRDDSLLEKDGTCDSPRLRMKLRIPTSREGIRALFSDVTERSWFRRIWAVQEIAVSKDALIVCGHDVITWPKFSSLLYAVLGEMDALNFDVTFGDGADAFVERFRICKLVSAGLKASLPVLVANTRLLRSTDARDIVYALLGLACNVSNDVSLSPTYSPSTSRLHVYRTLVEHAIRVEQRLDIICLRRRYDQLGGSWPSWIPDWSAPPPVLSKLDPYLEQPKDDWIEGSSLLNSPLIDRYRALSGHETTHSYNWSADKGTLPACQISLSPLILKAVGVSVDVICDLGEPFYFETKQWSGGDMSAWEEVFLRNFGNCKDDDGITVINVSDECLLLRKAARAIGLIHGSKRRRVNARLTHVPSIHRMLSRTALRRRMRRAQLQKIYPARMDAYVGGGSMVEAYARTLFLDNVLSCKGSSRGTREEYDLFRTGRWREGALSLDTVVFNDRKLGVNIIHRHLIVSRKGYLGLGPVPAQKGDQICVLLGCSVPVVIRKVEDCHILIGECYIHKLMDGQALDLLAKGDAVKEEFHFR